MRAPGLLFVLLFASSLSGQSSCIPQLDAPREYAVPGVGRVAAADLDGDGYADLVASGQFSVAVLYGRGETLEPAVPLLAEASAWFIADVDAACVVASCVRAESSVPMRMRNGSAACSLEIFSTAGSSNRSM